MLGVIGRLVSAANLRPKEHPPPTTRSLTENARAASQFLSALLIALGPYADSWSGAR